MTCGAKTRSGFLCKKPPLTGKTRCRLHGGMSLSGKDHPNFKHGRFTKEGRRRTVEGNAQVRYWEDLAIRLGLMRAAKQK